MKPIALRLWPLVGLLVAAARLGGAEPAFPAYSRQTIEDLDVGETCVFALHDGTARNIRLLSVDEWSDSVFARVRRAEVLVEIDGRPLVLACAPYAMPSVAEGIRLQADATAGFRPDLPKQVQLSIWDANDPIVDTSRLVFPLPDYEWQSQGMQTYAEVCWLGVRDDQSAKSAYHNYGVDFAGSEARDEVRSPVSGTVLGVWTEMPVSWDRGSVVVADDAGLWWELAHLDRTVAGLTKGRRLSAGDPVGWLGVRGPSGGFPHLHVGTYFATGPVEWNVNRRLNLYPWLLAAYQAQSGKNLYAIAGGHRLVRVGESAVFDGSPSLSFDSKIVSARWVFSDGESVDGWRAEKSFPAAGVYSAALWVEDALGRRDVAFCEVRVFPPGEPQPPPRLRLTGHPSSGARAGTPVRFRAWPQGLAAGRIVLDFGDGGAPREYALPADVDHAYARAGLYVVTARLLDADVPAVRQIKLAVAPAAP